MKLDTETIEASQQRDGQAADDRGDEVDELLNTNTLGYRDGDNLVGDSYEIYPDNKADLTNPNGMKEFLESLFSHNLVTSYDEAVVELTAGTADIHRRNWKESLKSATRIFDINAEELFQETNDDDNDEDTLTALLEYEVADDVADDLLIAELYVEAALSASEIADVLETKEKHVMDRLKHVNLVNGKTTQEQKESFSANKGRLTTPSDSNGLTVDTSNL